jgi:hypothetical protein
VGGGNEQSGIFLERLEEWKWARRDRKGTAGIYQTHIKEREREREREGGKAAEASEKRGRWIDVGRGCDVTR